MALLDKCTNVKRLRITGIEAEGDLTFLDKYMSIGGIDADGNAVSTCSLVGTYRLTRYIEDESEFNVYREHYPELKITRNA